MAALFHYTSDARTGPAAYRTLPRFVSGALTHWGQMPRSLTDGKAWISHEVARLRPATLLDVGPGQGTYSDLLRGVTPGSSWSCVEIFEPYVEMFELRRKYDVVHVADIRSFSWPTRYDVVILGDVLEHLTLADALPVWASARAHARSVVLSIPIVEYPQGVHYGNIHETHLHVWSHESVVGQLDGICRWQRHAAIGVYLAHGTCEEVMRTA